MGFSSQAQSGVVLNMSLVKVKVKTLGWQRSRLPLGQQGYGAEIYPASLDPEQVLNHCAALPKSRPFYRGLLPTLLTEQTGSVAQQSSHNCSWGFFFRPPFQPLTADKREE